MEHDIRVFLVGAETATSPMYQVASRASDSPTREAARSPTPSQGLAYPAASYLTASTFPTTHQSQSDTPCTYTTDAPYTPFSTPYQAVDSILETHHTRVPRCSSPFGREPPPVLPAPRSLGVEAVLGSGPLDLASDETVSSAGAEARITAPPPSRQSKTPAEISPYPRFLVQRVGPTDQI